MKRSSSALRCLKVAALGGMLLVVAFAGTVWANVTPGSTGTITIDSPYSQNGATAVIWGYYTANVVGSTEATFGSGTFSGGVATINYTIPANYKANSDSFYWNTNAYASGSSGAVSDYEDNSGALGPILHQQPQRPDDQPKRLYIRSVQRRPQLGNLTRQRQTAAPPSRTNTPGVIAMWKCPGPEPWHSS